MFQGVTCVKNATLQKVRCTVSSPRPSTKVIGYNTLVYKQEIQKHPQTSTKAFELL